MINSSSINTAPINGRILSTVSEAVSESELIPVDAKAAIKDFLRETFGDLWINVQDIANLTPPDWLIEYWDIILEVISHI